MFELLTGQKPYYDVKNNEIYQVVGKNVLPQVPPTGVSPLLTSFDTLIHKCWNRVADDRPPASILITELESLATSIAAGTSTPTLSPNKPSVRPPSRFLVADYRFLICIFIGIRSARGGCGERLPLEISTIFPRAKCRDPQCRGYCRK